MGRIPTDLSYIAIAIGAVVLITASLHAKWLYDMTRLLARIHANGGQASLPQLLLMKARRTPIVLVVDTYLALLHAGEDVTLVDVEKLYLQKPEAIESHEDLVTAFTEAGLCDN